jgi:hypothetical protein
MPDQPGPSHPIIAVPAATQEEVFVRIYSCEEMSRELRQAEIISDLVHYVYDPAADIIEQTAYDYAVILSQDCDLLQDYNKTAAGQAGDLNGVIVYGATSAAGLLAGAGGRDIRGRIIKNKDERYHLLQKVESGDDTAGTGLPSLIIDFKKLFTMPAQEIYRQCAAGGGAHRRCRLETPYKEHLQSRAAFYFSRIGIPEQHMYTPES